LLPLLLLQIRLWVDTIGATVAIFQFPPLTPPNGRILYQNLRKKFDFLGFRGGWKGFRVEIEKSEQYLGPRRKGVKDHQFRKIAMTKRSLTL